MRSLTSHTPLHTHTRSPLAHLSTRSLSYTPLHALRLSLFPTHPSTHPSTHPHTVSYTPLPRSLTRTTDARCHRRFPDLGIWKRDLRAEETKKSKEFLDKFDREVERMHSEISSMLLEAEQSM